MNEHKEDKPRMCEIIGVDVGQDFTITGFDYNGKPVVFRINSIGDYETTPPKCPGSSYAIMSAINIPLLVNIIPVYTEEEKNIFRGLLQMGVKWVSKDDADPDFNVRLWRNKPESLDNIKHYYSLSDKIIGELTASLLPSVKCGDCVNLAEVVGYEDDLLL